MSPRQRSRDETEEIIASTHRAPDQFAGLSLFEAPSVGVPTSEAAADAVETRAGRAKAQAVRMRLLRLIASREQGYTADELEAATGINGNTIRPRVGELMHAGYVEPSTTITRTTRAGKSARCLFATSKARRLLEEAA